MPIYMDRHDVSEAVTAEIVAQIHREDLKIQHKYGCRGLTYWFDATRKTAFCLVEAPNGPVEYKGREMPETHTGMNISATEYMETIDDIMGVLNKHKIDEQSKKDVLAILWSLKGMTMGK